MRRFIIIATMIVLVTACQKADHNGDLGGFWQLLEIERNDTALRAKEDKIFWSIQLDMLATTSEDDNSYNYNYGGKGRFQHVGNMLSVQIITKSPSSDLRKVGLYTPDDERFEVLLLNKDKMVLRSEHVLLEFRKF